MYVSELLNRDFKVLQAKLPMYLSVSCTENLAADGIWKRSAVFAKKQIHVVQIYRNSRSTIAALHKQRLQTEAKCHI